MNNQERLELVAGALQRAPLSKLEIVGINQILQDLKKELVDADPLDELDKGEPKK